MCVWLLKKEGEKECAHERDRVFFLGRWVRDRYREILSLRRSRVRVCVTERERESKEGLREKIAISKVSFFLLTKVNR